MDRYVTLAVVRDGQDRRIVELPANGAKVGDLVEYTVPPIEMGCGYRDVPEETRIGLVSHTMAVETLSDEWAFVAELGRIIPAKAAYSCHWSEKPENT